MKKIIAPHLQAAVVNNEYSEQKLQLLNNNLENDRNLYTPLEKIVRIFSVDLGLTPIGCTLCVRDLVKFNNSHQRMKILFLIACNVLFVRCSRRRNLLLPYILPQKVLAAKIVDQINLTNINHGQ